jgi:2-dehydro-3-deoxygluconokinase
VFPGFGFSVTAKRNTKDFEKPEGDIVQTEQRALDVITFGETMLRLSAPGCSRLEETDTLDVRIGGSESNTAVALARLGMRAAWWSKLPANPLGRRIENEIRRWGVDTSGMLWDESPQARAGLYFLDFGLPPRGIDVYYDRAQSSASKITALEVDAQKIAEARLLHLTGITPALSPYCAKAVLRAMHIAKESGTLVSFDINYRSRLWPPETARQELGPLFSQVDLLLCPLGDAKTVFGIAGEGIAVAKELRDHAEVEAVVVTCGEAGAAVCTEKGAFQVDALVSPHIIDRVGRGDAFNAGVLMGFLQNDLKLGAQYGAAMAALKQTMPGDILLSNRAEIDAALAAERAAIQR